MEPNLKFVIGKNGTFEEVENEEFWLWGEYVVMCFTIISGMFLNLALVGAIASTKCKNQLFRPILALSLASAYDSIINQTLLLLFMVLWWDQPSPSFLCRFSASSSVFAISLQFSYLASAALSCLPCKTVLPLYLLLALPICLAASVSAPMMLMKQTVVIKQFQQRNICGLIGDSPSYSIIVLALGFVTSFMAIIYFLVIMRCFVYSSDWFFQCNVEPRESKFLGVLLLVASFLLLPHIIYINKTNLSPFDSNSEMVVTSGIDKMFTYLKCQFNVMVPVITFIFFRELRKEFNYIFCFCKKNKVSEEIPYLKIERISKNTKANETTPVLFATSNGLVLRIFDNWRICDIIGSETESTLQSIFTEVSSSVEKRNTQNRKIVRFAHFVNEIPTNFEWASNSSNSNAETQ